MAAKGLVNNTFNSNIMKRMYLRKILTIVLLFLKHLTHRQKQPLRALVAETVINIEVGF